MDSSESSVDDLPREIWSLILNQTQYTVFGSWEYRLSFVEMLYLSSTCRALREMVLSQHTYWRDQALSFPKCNFWFESSALALQNRAHGPTSVYFTTFSMLMQAIALDQCDALTANPPGCRRYMDYTGGDCGFVLGPIYPWRKDYTQSISTTLNAWLRAHYYKAQYTLWQSDSGNSGAAASEQSKSSGFGQFEIASCAQQFRSASVWHDIFAFCGRAGISFSRRQTAQNNILRQVVRCVWVGLRGELDDTASDLWLNNNPQAQNFRAAPDRPLTRFERFQRGLLFPPEDSPGGDWDSDVAKACMTRCANAKCNKYFPYKPGRYTHYHVGTIANLTHEPSPTLFCSFHCLICTAISTDMCVACECCGADMPLSACLGLSPTMRLIGSDLQKSRRRLESIPYESSSYLSMTLNYEISNVASLWPPNMYPPHWQPFSFDHIKARGTPPPTPYPACRHSLDEWEARLSEHSTPVPVPRDWSVDAEGSGRFNHVTHGIGYGQPVYTDGMPSIECRRAPSYTENRPVYVFYCSAACAKNEEPVRCGNYECRKVLHPEFAPASLECAELLFCAPDGTRSHRGYVCDKVCGERLKRQLAERALHKQRQSRKRRLAAFHRPSPSKKPRVDPSPQPLSKS